MEFVGFLAPIITHVLAFVFLLKNFMKLEKFLSVTLCAKSRLRNRFSFTFQINLVVVGYWYNNSILSASCFENRCLLRL